MNTTIFKSRIARLASKTVALLLLLGGMGATQVQASKYVMLSSYAIPCLSFSWYYGYSPLDPSRSYYRLRIDPYGFQSFQFDLQFNPAYLTFEGAEFVNSYVAGGALDLSSVGTGLIQDVDGVTTLAVPPNAPVDIVILDFLPTAYGADPAHCFDAIGFTAFLSPNDSFVVMDTGTLATETYDAGRLAGFNASSSWSFNARICPDSTSWLMEGAALAGLALAAARARNRKR